MGSFRSLDDVAQLSGTLFGEGVRLPLLALLVVEALDLRFEGVDALLACDQVRRQAGDGRVSVGVRLLCFAQKLGGALKLLYSLLSCGGDTHAARFFFGASAASASRMVISSTMRSTMSSRRSGIRTSDS